MKRLGKEEIERRLFVLHGDQLKIDFSTYKANYIKARFIDEEYGDWWALLKNVLKGQSHPARAREKLEQTNLKKYGARRPLQSDKVKKGMIERNIEKFGCEYPMQNEEIKERAAQTNLERYGHRAAWQNEEVKEKIRQTNLERYGFECSALNEEIRAKQIETLIERYGDGENPEDVSSPWSLGAIRDKSAETNLERYGTIHPTQNEEIREKVAQTNLERYGFACAIKNKEILERARQSNLERHGVEWPQQNKDIALKAARSRNNSVTLEHWRTREKIVCVASYEEKVVKYLNENKLDYEWQKAIFTMPDGRTYRPDFYLYGEKVWVEIKGYFWKDAREKWDWFCGSREDAELWDKKELENRKII